MTEQEATTRLKAMTAADTDPTLTDAEITSLLEMSRIADRYGVWPLNQDGTANTDWQPTYNLNIGAAEGWRWKAARAEGVTDAAVTSIRVGDVSKTFSTASERYQAKADMYAKKIAGSPRVRTFPPGWPTSWEFDI